MTGGRRTLVARMERSGMRVRYVPCPTPPRIALRSIRATLAEFSLRYTHRAGVGVSDVMRAAITLKGIEGKRLTYRRPDKA